MRAALWSLDGLAFSWGDGGVVAMPAADDTLDTLADRQAELERLFAQPADVPESSIGPDGEIVEGLVRQDPGTLEHAAAVARSLGARREL